MNLSLNKYVCECGWKGTDDDLLVGQNPFDQRFTVYGCPRCKDIEKFRHACDEPDCWEEVCAGTPTPNGYRHTCGKHVPK